MTEANKMQRVFIISIAALLISIIAVIAAVLLRISFAWTNPTQAPPGGSGSGIIPTGQVAFFNLSSCPSGWTESTAARGRYVVGKPSGGTLAGTAGTALANLEDRAVGQHNHGISDPGHQHSVHYGGTFGWTVLGATSIGAPSTNWGAGTYGPVTNVVTTGITINNAGSVAGTNAPYIQYLVCQKD